MMQVHLTGSFSHLKRYNNQETITSHNYTLIIIFY